VRSSGAAAELKHWRQPGQSPSPSQRRSGTQTHRERERQRDCLSHAACSMQYAVCGVQCAVEQAAHERPLAALPVACSLLNACNWARPSRPARKSTISGVIFFHNSSSARTCWPRAPNWPSNSLSLSGKGRLLFNADEKPIEERLWLAIEERGGRSLAGRWRGPVSGSGWPTDKAPEWCRSALDGGQMEEAERATDRPPCVGQCVLVALVFSVGHAHKVTPPAAHRCARPAALVASCARQWPRADAKTVAPSEPTRTPTGSREG